MRIRIPTPYAVLAPAAVALAATLAAARPAPAVRDDPKAGDDPLKPQLPFEMNEDQEELLRLFHEVERKLVAIDEKLMAAGAGEAPLEEVEDSGLEKLLRSTSSDSQNVVENLDKILEIAERMGGTCSKPGGSSGESPLDQPRDTGPTPRERTPEAPPSGEDQEQQGQKPDPQETGGDDPHDNGPNPPEGENRDGRPRQDPAGPAVPRVDDADAWGYLPQRVQETFRNQGREDMPVQYRDWIDSYYRRLNKSR